MEDALTKFLSEHFLMTNLWMNAAELKARWIRTVLRIGSVFINSWKQKTEGWTEEKIRRKRRGEERVWILDRFIYSCIHGVGRILSFVGAGASWYQPFHITSLRRALTALFADSTRLSFAVCLSLTLNNRLVSIITSRKDIPEAAL